MDEDGPEHSLTQTRPAPLVFELADHLQQFVGVVVDPARTAHDGRARLFGFRARGRARFGDRLGVQGSGGLEDRSRPRPRSGLDFRGEAGFGADKSCAGLSDCGLDSAGPLGSFTLAGASLVGIRSRGASEGTHMPCRLRIRVLPVYSLIPGNAAGNSAPRTMVSADSNELTRNRPEGDSV